MFVVLITALYLALPNHAEGAEATQGKAATLANDHVLAYKPGLNVGKMIVGRPDSDMVELSGGRRISVGDIRKQTNILMRLKQPKAHPTPAAMILKPGVPVMKVANAADVAEALKRPDSDTVELKSGKRVTVAMLKFFQPQVEKKLGRRLDAVSVRKPNLTGATTKVTAQTDWQKIRQLPDDTILEAPSGKRITVGMMKQALAKDPDIITRISKRQTAPAAAPKQR